MGVFSGALYQCDEADAPTDDRALGENLLVVGPPQLDEQGNYFRAASEKRLAGARDDRESIRVFRNPRV